MAWNGGVGNALPSHATVGDALAMSKPAPDHHDAELILRVYDLRREPVMRESRDAINRDFWPRNEAEALAIVQPEHPLNRAWRQTSTYWEMVYGFARHGVVHTDMLLESNGEGLLLFARMEPYLAALRAQTSPRSLRNCEWIAGSGELAKAVMQTFRGRIQKRLGK
jgi:hypothetical protein